MLSSEIFDIVFCLKLTMVIVSIGSVITSIEDLSILKHFKNEEILSWEVSSLNYPWLVKGRIAAFIDQVLSFNRFKFIIVIKLISSGLIATLAFLLNDWLLSILLLLAALTTFSFNIRNPFGLDGAHQMTLILFTTLFLGSITENASFGQHACIWFIVIQACLSYFVAGVYKLISPVWRSGQALIGISSTKMYGNKWVYGHLSNNIGLSKVFGWTVIVFECTFPLIFADLELALFYLLLGFLFHFATAIFMSLNIFFWTFIATYPAIIYCIKTMYAF